MPTTALFAEALIAVCNLLTEIVKGQPPEVKKQLWEWHVNDLKELRQLLGIKV